MFAVSDVFTFVGEYIPLVASEYATPASVGYIAFEFAVQVASGFVVEYILFGDKVPALVVEYITFAPIEFVEAALMTLMRSYAMMRLRIYAMCACESKAHLETRLAQPFISLGRFEI